MVYEDEHFIDTAKMVWNFSLFTDEAVQYFQQGNLCNAYDYFGAHAVNVLKTRGFYFSVWAPHAKSVSVVGEFNGWKHHLHKLYVRQDSSGIWEGFIPLLEEKSLYKYHITGINGVELFKADPYAIYAELRPKTASVMRSLTYDWKDEKWMKNRKERNSLSAPWSVYEIQLASWMRPVKDDDSAYTSYLDLIDRLVPYVKSMGFTHVEFMPVMEFPYDGSWGYQGTGFFAATSRFGTPQEFMMLIDALHQNNIGVILDWVPSHFPKDDHGLYMFDGTHTYEYADMRKGFHVDWNSYIFNYKRGEVVSFLISSAHFWMKKYHADGLRVDAVNSIIRLDFSRKEGQWEPNEHGGNQNLEAIAFIQKLNDSLYRDFPEIQTIAEEASDWPGITAPTKEGGLGFGMKWMMGWMHDNFKYFRKSPDERRNSQNDLTFSMMYFYKEKYMMPLSHDEVVHGKSPMIYKMPGNEWEQFANLRLLYSWMFTHPGGKLLFMGNEFGQTSEWNHSSELDWELLQYAAHEGVQECVRELNRIYRQYPAMHELQFDKRGFKWLDIDHQDEGIICFERKTGSQEENLVVVLNMTNIPQQNWKLHVRNKESWQEIFNSDDTKYWGSGKYVNRSLKASKKKR